MPANGKKSTEASRRERDWGYYELLHDSERYQIRRLVVEPKKQLEYQYHVDKNEDWQIVSGRAEVRLGWDRRYLERGAKVSVPMGMPHWINNPFSEPLEIVEVQWGAQVRDDDSVKTSSYDEFKAMVRAWSASQGDSIPST